MTTRHHQEVGKSIAKQARLSGTHDDLMKGEGRRRSYHTQVAGLLVAAFTLSLFYMVVVTVTDSHEGYTMADSALWPAFVLFYGLGFGLSALALTNKP